MSATTKKSTTEKDKKSAGFTAKRGFAQIDALLAKIAA